MDLNNELLSSEITASLNAGNGIRMIDTKQKGRLEIKTLHQTVTKAHDLSSAASHDSLKFQRTKSQEGRKDH